MYANLLIMKEHVEVEETVSERFWENKKINI